MKCKTVYIFNANTKEFVTRLNLSDVNYLSDDGTWKTMPNSTDIAPPEEKDGYIRVFKDGGWSYEEEMY